MRKRLLVGLPIALAVLVALAMLIPASRWALIGWARGESFYRGKPTSYWRTSIQEYNRDPKQYLASSWGDNVLNFLGIASEKVQPPFADIASPNVDEATAVPVLVELLDDEDEQVALHAATFVSWTGPRGKPAIPALIRMLRHANVAHRREAVLALWSVCGGSPEAVPALIEALEDDDEVVVCFAAETLARIGPGARDAIPALVLLLKGNRAETICSLKKPGIWTLGNAAAHAVKKIDPRAAVEAGIQ